MAHLEFAVPNPIVRAVQAIWWHAEPSASRQTLLPDGFVELCFQCGRARLAGRPLPDVYILGLQTQPLELEFSAQLRVIGVRFYAWAAMSALGLEGNLRGFQSGVGASLIELSRTVLPLVERGDPAAAVQILEPWLTERIRAPHTGNDALRGAGQQIMGSVGAVRIADLAAMLGVSQRQLERLFKNATGVAPKRLARLVRFQQAARRLYDDPNVNLADLAVDLGFADQAHFNREFRNFSRSTPTEFTSNLSNTAPPALP